MFIGHFAVGLAAKRVAPETSLGTLFLSAQFLDLLWPLLLLAGLEHVAIVPGITQLTPLDFTDYPWSHSLLMALVWGLLLGAAYFGWKRSLKAGLLVGLLVVSHWVLDGVVHRPDLPLAWGDSSRWGLGLWNEPWVAIPLELALFGLGLRIYLKCTRHSDGWGRWGSVTLAGLLLVIWAANLTGPPPPSVTALAIVGNAQWLFVALAYWLDRHRVRV